MAGPLPYTACARVPTHASVCPHEPVSSHFSPTYHHHFSPLCPMPDNGNNQVGNQSTSYSPKLRPIADHDVDDARFHMRGDGPTSSGESSSHRGGEVCWPQADIEYLEPIVSIGATPPSLRGSFTATVGFTEDRVSAHVNGEQHCYTYASFARHFACEMSLYQVIEMLDRWAKEYTWMYSTLPSGHHDCKVRRIIPEKRNTIRNKVRARSVTVGKSLSDASRLALVDTRSQTAHGGLTNQQLVQTHRMIPRDHDRAHHHLDSRRVVDVATAGTQPRVNLAQRHERN